MSVKESISLGKRSCYTDKSVIVNLFRTFYYQLREEWGSRTTTATIIVMPVGAVDNDV